LASVTDADQGTTDYAYDRVNRLIAVTDPNDHTTTYLLDEVGNPLQRTSPDSGITVFRYDAIGLVETTDARGITEQYRYDARNRPRQIHYPDSAYDILLSYDGAEYSRDVPASWRKTAIGQRTGMTDPSGHTRWFYNRYGDLEQIDTFFDDLGDSAYSQQFEYDYSDEPGVGRLTSHRYPDGHAFDYRYDNDGRVSAIDSVAAGTTTPVVADVEYRPVAADGIAAFTFGNGLTYQRRVDALGRLTELTVQGHRNILHRQWRHSPAHDVAAIDDVLNPAENRSYRYDPLHRLTDAEGPAIHTYRYDANGNRLSKNSAVYTPAADSNRLLAIIDGSDRIDIEYDTNGNRIRQTANGSTLVYQYDPRNRLASISDDGRELATYQYNGLGQRVIKRTAAATEYSLYGPQGQRISLLQQDGSLLHDTLYWNGRPLAHYRPAAADRYRFTSRNKNRYAALTVDLTQRRLQLTRYDGSLLDFVIDKAQWQVKETRKATVYEFAIADNGKGFLLKGSIQLRSSGDLGVARLVDKTGGPADKKTKYRLNGGRVPDEYYYHTDHLGTPQVMTDRDQAVVWQASYDPFGQASLSTEVIDNDLRLPGQYFDAESGLFYNWFRYYDPAIGKYITSDPIGLGGGLNTYGYVAGNPIRFVDPTGQQATSLSLKAIGGLSLVLPVPGARPLGLTLIALSLSGDTDSTRTEVSIDGLPF